MGAGGKQAIRFQRGRGGGPAGRWMEMVVEEEEGAEQTGVEKVMVEGGRSLVEVEKVVEGGRQGQRGRSWK